MTSTGPRARLTGHARTSSRTLRRSDRIAAQALADATLLAGAWAFLDALLGAGIEQLRAQLRAAPDRELSRVAALLRLRRTAGDSPELHTALRAALLDPSATAATVALALLHAGEERARRRTVAGVLGRARYEAPDALDRLAGTTLPAPDAAESLARSIVTAGRPHPLTSRSHA